MAVWRPVLSEQVAAVPEPDRIVRIFHPQFHNGSYCNTGVMLIQVF